MSRFARRLQRGSINTLADRGPVSFASLTAARAALNAPSDANYVVWNSSWPVDRDLEDVFALELGANDILVLPERPEPYVIDSSEGFRASGVQSVTGRNGQVAIVNRYKGIRGARTWFAMARARRGILGLGPNAVIEVSNSSWTQEPQIQDAGSVQEDGWTSPGRYWTNTSGVVQSELVGCQEKVIEAAHATPYFGNFTMRSHSLGGVAYSAIGVGSTTASTFERLNLSGAWRGFLGVPNGEAGGIGISGHNYFISRCILGTRDSSGTRVATSPIMINNSSGGRIEHVYAGESYAGMLTIWNSSGTHTLDNVDCRFNWGPGINLEKCQSGFTFVMNGGSIWSDYYGNGGKSPKPSDQGTKGRLHIGIYSEVGSANITLNGVDLDTGPTAGALNLQSYGTTQQTVSTIHCYDTQGASVPIKAYGLN